VWRRRFSIICNGSGIWLIWGFSGEIDNGIGGNEATILRCCVDTGINQDLDFPACSVPLC
jgi:hypothetical protein